MCITSYLILVLGGETHTLCVEFKDKVAFCHNGKFDKMKLETVLNLPGFVSVELAPF